MKIGRLQIGRNKNIERKNYTTKQEYKFDKSTDVVPKKKNRLICIIFSEEKGCHFILRKLNAKTDCFRFHNGIYLIDNESIHITGNGSRVAFYLEGITTPIKMSNIEKETIEMDYIDLYGKKQKTIIQKIKGLKFDSKILDIFANRKFAELFTKTPTPMTGLLTLILSIIGIILIVVGYGVVYYYR
jgi:hypothetical protein